MDKKYWKKENEGTSKMKKFTGSSSYLEKYVDPKQLVMVWDSLSADDKKLYADYRQYLLDYTKSEGWYEQNPLTFEEWKESNSSETKEVI